MIQDLVIQGTRGVCKVCGSYGFIQGIHDVSSFKAAGIHNGMILHKCFMGTVVAATTVRVLRNTLRSNV